MKLVSQIARYLMGLMFTVFGLNGFLHFIPQQMPPNPVAVQFITALGASGYMVPIFALQLVCGILLLVNRFVPLALTVLAAIIFNILVFHFTMAPGTAGPGVIVAILWVLVFLSVKERFAPLLRA